MSEEGVGKDREGGGRGMGRERGRSGREEGGDGGRRGGGEGGMEGGGRSEWGLPSSGSPAMSKGRARA